MNIQCIFGAHKPLNPGNLGFMQARNPSGDIVLILELCERCHSVFWRLPLPAEVVREREARLAAAEAQLVAAVNDRKVVPMDHQRKKRKATPQDYVPKPPVLPPQ